MSPKTAALTPEQLRRNRRLSLRDECARVESAHGAAEGAVRLRDADLEAWQGKPSEGKFTYTELSEITGLSRTRLSQIIGAIRRGER